MAVYKASMEIENGGYASLHVGGGSPDTISLAVHAGFLSHDEAIELSSYLLNAARRAKQHMAETDTPSQHKGGGE